jgi:environmental stress-induced protein Ves
MTVRVLRAADHERMPWRNGGGVTAQVACFPDSDGSAPFDWRVSFASVETSGPFSTFPGVDRVIVLVDGPSMTLTVDGVPHVLQRHQPFAFDGGSRSECTVQAPTLDLNVMTRRGTVEAEVAVTELDQIPFPTRAADDLLVAVLSGELRVTHEGQVHELRACDVFHSSERHGPTLAGTGTVAVISLTLPQERNHP